MSNQFGLLTLNEENKLSKDELNAYYSDLRRYIFNRKLTNTTFGATRIGPKLKKVTDRIAIAVTKLFSTKNLEWICDGTDTIPNETVIFAHSHQGILDGFVWIPRLNRHCLILMSSEVSKLLIFCQCNTGLILVKKGDKASSLNAKLDMIQLLLNGHSIAYFPEGAWNLSPNKLHLPMRYGFLDIARKANVPVVPVVHEYSYDKKGNITKIHTRYGTPIRITAYDSINMKFEEYLAQISTMRFELIEEKGIHHRISMDNSDYINYLNASYKHLQLGNVDIEKERSNIYGSTDDFYLFHHINDVSFNENGELLETEETRRLQQLLSNAFPSLRI